MNKSLAFEDLLALYKLAIDEYRFEVTITSSRVQYYLVFNTGLLGVGTGLLKFEGSWYANVVIAGIFLTGAGCCLLGIRAIEHSHRYYRRTIVKKTLIEDLLGLAQVRTADRKDVDLTISTTGGQADRQKITRTPDEYVAQRIRRGSATGSATMILYLLLIINTVACVFAATLAYRAAVSLPAADALHL